MHHIGRAKKYTKEDIPLLLQQPTFVLGGNRLRRVALMALLSEPALSSAPADPTSACLCERRKAAFAVLSASI